MRIDCFGNHRNAFGAIWIFTARAGAVGIFDANGLIVFCGIVQKGRERLIVKRITKANLHLFPLVLRLLQKKSKSE